MKEFSPIDPSGKAILTADFVDELAAGETISSATVTASVMSGVDNNPQAIISGAATISGSKVSQMVANPKDGVYYCLTWSATTSLGQVLVAAFLVRGHKGC